MLVKIDNAHGMARNTSSNAVVVTDESSYDAYRRRVRSERIASTVDSIASILERLEQRMTIMEERLRLLEED